MVFDFKSCTRNKPKPLGLGRSSVWERVFGSWAMYRLCTRSTALCGGGLYDELAAIWAALAAAE